MILEETNDKVSAIVERFGGEQKAELEQELRRLISRTMMDVRNMFSRQMSEIEMEIKSIPTEANNAS